MARKWRVFYRRVRSVLKGGLALILLAGVGLAIALATQVFVPASATQPQDVEIGDPRRGLVSNPSELNARGRQLLAQGDARGALSVWQQAEKGYRQQGDLVGAIGTQINQARALQAFGRYRQALKRLFETRETLETNETELDPQSRSQLNGLLRVSLGNAFRGIGDLNHSHEVLAEAIADLDGTQFPDILGNALLSAGNTERDIGQRRLEALYSDRVEDLLREVPPNQREFLHDTQAREFYQAALDLYGQAERFDSLQLQARLNRLSLLAFHRRWWGDRMEQFGTSQPPSFWLELTRDANRLVQQVRVPPMGSDRASAEARVNLAESLMALYKHPQALNAPSWETVDRLFAESLQWARDRGDRWMESYVLGKLGERYERTEQWQQAQARTREALEIAADLEASVPIYQWQWQLGRLARRNSRDRALSYYRQAIDTVERLRHQNLVAIDFGLPEEVTSEIQVDFRERVEPLYREFAALLLDSETAGRQPTQEDLKQARETIQALQRVELENFLQCEIPQQQNRVSIDRLIDERESTTAAFYPILFGDRLAVILKLPGRELAYYETPVTEVEVQKTLDALRPKLQTPYSFKDMQALSRQMYEWLVQPAESELAAGQIDTLVFVLDLALQNLPLSALYDGEGYLIERYAIAQNTGLEVINRPQPLTEVAFHPLLGALSENPNVENFVPLEFADEEVTAIQNLLGDARVLMDRKFTKESFQNELVAQDYNVIHLVTHGQFSSDPRQTFLLTAPTDEPSEESKLAPNVIYVNELDKVLQTRFQATRQDIDLLVLSACETAKVDNRATLGLAGVAQRAGASSTLASLWNLYDESAAEFMPMFYQKLVEQNVSKAEALRLTQLEFLQNPEYRNRYAHPVFWASYVLVGNWL